MQRWSTRTVQELTGEAKRRGYTGYCVDLSHLRGKPIGGYTLNPWQETLPQLLPFTQELHVSAGRYDMGYQKTEEELKDLIRGTRNTQLPQMLDFIKRADWSGRVVTEIPPLALHRLRGNSSFLSINNLMEDHQEIVQNIKAVLC
jgi:hypothetical protein